MRRLTGPLSCALAIAGVVGVLAEGHGVRQQEPGADAARPAAPLLWRIEGEPPAYLYGTIHVPDARVLRLPARIEAVLAEADAVYTEIPMDLETQLALSDHVMLPADQRLRDVAGDALYERLAAAVAGVLEDHTSAPATGILTAMLDRLKPWAALGQVAMLEYLPDMVEGRQPLDALLYSRAEQAGKSVAGLETIEEQVAAFEAFTLDEQLAMLRSALDEWDETRAAGTTPAEALVAAYLSGDVDRLNEIRQEAVADPGLTRKFERVMIRTRNRRMAERIVEIRRAEPDAVSLFAVGALHLVGPDGIPELLERQGFSTTRVTD